MSRVRRGMALSGLPALLLRNETEGGHWLQVRVRGSGGLNRMGIGAVVKAYPAGRCGDASALLGAREVAAGYGYTSGQEAAVHLGLGGLDECDLEVLLPHGRGKLVRKGVRAGQVLTVDAARGHSQP